MQIHLVILAHQLHLKDVRRQYQGSNWSCHHIIKQIQRYYYIPWKKLRIMFKKIGSIFGWKILKSVSLQCRLKTKKRQIKTALKGNKTWYCSIPWMLVGSTQTTDEVRVKALKKYTKKKRKKIKEYSNKI